MALSRWDLRRGDQGDCPVDAHLDQSMPAPFHETYRGLSENFTGHFTNLGAKVDGGQAFELGSERFLTASSSGATLDEELACCAYECQGIANPDDNWCAGCLP